MAHLRVDERVFRACHEHEAFHLEKIGELGWIELADGDRVALLVMRGDKLAEVLDEREVAGCKDD